MPSKLRKVIRSSNITKKAGATKAEALRNRTRLLMEIEQRFRDADANDPVLATFKQVQPGDDRFEEVLASNLKIRWLHSRRDHSSTARWASRQGAGSRNKERQQAGSVTQRSSDRHTVVATVDWTTTDRRAAKCSNSGELEITLVDGGAMDGNCLPIRNDQARRGQLQRRATW